jgi:hypothetical protein
MECEKAGVLRAYLDSELDAVSASRLEQHLSECPQCQARMEQLRANASTVAVHLRSLAAPPDVAARQEARAWLDLKARLRGERSGEFTKRTDVARPVLDSPARTNHSAGPTNRRWKMPIHLLSLRRRSALAVALAAVFLLVVVPVGSLSMFPSGRATAIGFLNLFRPQQFTAVQVDTSTPFKGLSSLEKLGTISMPSRSYDPQVTGDSLGEVGTWAGIKVLQPATMPSQLNGTPVVMELPGAEATFTVDRQKAEAYLRSVGAANPNVPAELDGAQLTIRVPNTVMLAYGDSASQPQFLVAELQMPTAIVEGNTDLAGLRDFLLTVPDLPADTVAQLRSIDDWTTTVPIPIIKDRMNSRQIDVAGSQALAVSDPQSGLEGMIWQRDGVVYGLAGLVSQQELIAAAQSLR